MDRQLADCHRHATDLGWEVTAEHVDNGVSAYAQRKRPAFERLLSAIESGQVDGLLAWHPDRLYRRLGDLDRFVETVQAAGIPVVTVRAGDMDLDSATGRMVAGILGSVSRGESERMAERVSRAKLQLAEQGRPAGGGKRPFGFEGDRVTLHPLEAPALAAAAERIAMGGTYLAEVRALNDAGLRSTMGQHWTVGTLRRVLTSPRVAGLRAYKGKVVGPAAWPAIIDRGTWDLLRDEAHRRRSGGRPESPGRLLTGHVWCAECGLRLYGYERNGRTVYRCVAATTTRGKGCAKVSITGLDEHVVDVVGGWLHDPAFVRHLGSGPDDSPLRAELDAIDARLAAMAERWAQADSDVLELEQAAARRPLLARRAELSDLLASQPRQRRPADPAALVEAWDSEDPTLRRGIIAAVSKPIFVGSARIRGADRVNLEPIWK